jgi:S-adenosylmethionine hydrolase
VVDPGVGSNRKPILLTTENGFYIGPDNGLFSLIWKNSKNRKVFWLKNEKYFFSGTSRTFDSRDVFGPTAAYLSLGVALEEFGPALSSIQLLPFPEPVKRGRDRGGPFAGEIIYIDRFGNLVTNFTCKMVEGKNIEVKLGSCRMKGLASNYTSIPKGQTASILGSLGYLEIAGNAFSAQKLMKVKIGTKVELTLV